MKLSRLAFALLLITASVPVTNAAADGEAPLVDAGLDQSVVAGTTVYLDGGGTVDPDGEIATYSWSIETPHGESSTPTDPNAEMTRFVPDQTGRYQVQLTAIDEDGNSRNDTLFVDVGGAVDSRPDSAETISDEPVAPMQRTPDQVADTSTAIVAQLSQNQAPYGQILGPDSVRSGSSARYVLEAGDADGKVTDFQWLPSSHSSDSSGMIDPRSVDQTYSFDVEPGTTVKLPVVLVDNDGERSTVTKRVQVTNNPPEAMIHGKSTVAVGSVHEYEISASDPDGPVTSFAWAINSRVVEPVNTGGIVNDGSTRDSSKSQLYRFTAIPEDDATVSLRATVGDEHGGAATAEKGVTVVSLLEESTVPQLENPSSPKIQTYEATQSDIPTQLFGSQKASPGRIVFTAVATDNDSEQLTFEWQFGELGSAETVESGVRIRSEVSFPFGVDEVDYLTGVPITVTVTDQNGNSRSVTETLDFEERPGGRQVDESLTITAVDGKSIRGSVNIPISESGASAPSNLKVFFGDGTSQTLTKADQTGEQTKQYQFDHRYTTSGNYVLQAQRDSSISRTTVSVGAETYVEWQYEHKVTKETRTSAVERPGSDGWERVGLDSVTYQQTGVKSTQTQISNGIAINPGVDWKRTGTAVEHTTEQRTTQATESPGEDWELSERNLDSRTVFDGWKTNIVPSKLMADAEWEYVERVPKTVTNTETKGSASVPAGTGWERGPKTGDSVQTGYSTTWVTDQFYTGSDWEYLTSDRYITGYRESTTCIEYAYFKSGRYCTEETTSKSPNYDTRYKYKVPEYTDKYEWERTVEETEYDYEYRVETYSTEAVHQYSKDDQVTTEYAQWEKSTYNETKKYRWKKTHSSWEETTSLSEPSGDVRNVEKVERDCGEEWDTDEPQSCRDEEP